MAREQTAFRNSRLIAGTAMVGFGMFLLYENLAMTVAWLNHVLRANSEAVGILPAVILAVSQSLQTHAANHQHVLDGFLQHMLISSWPLLLVFAGTVLSHDTFTDNVAAPAQNNRGPFDLTNRQSTLRLKAHYQSGSSPLEVRQNRFAE